MFKMTDSADSDIDCKANKKQMLVKTNYETHT